MLSTSLMAVGIAAQAASAMLIAPLMVEPTQEITLPCAECVTIMKDPSTVDALSNAVPNLVRLAQGSPSISFELTSPRS
jgi:hypothetical protein